MKTLDPLLKYTASILLLPVCYGVFRSFVDLVFSLNKTAGARASWIYFICGFIAYGLFQLIFFKPMRTYVFGHELTHALASMIIGGKVRSFKVKKTGGNVTLTKTNLFVTLAPYFIPIYTLIFMAVYWLIKLFYDINAYYGVFLSITGFTLALHLSLTVFAIRQGQSDLKRYGSFFSLVIIFILNCTVLSLMLTLFFPVKLNAFAGLSVNYILDSYAFIYDLLRSIAS